VPEENFLTTWCKGRLTEADTATIPLGTTPSGLTSAHLHHSPSAVYTKMEHKPLRVLITTHTHPSSEAPSSDRMLKHCINHHHIIVTDRCIELLDLVRVHPLSQNSCSPRLYASLSSKLQTSNRQTTAINYNFNVLQSPRVNN